MGAQVVPQGLGRLEVLVDVRREHLLLALAHEREHDRARGLVGHVGALDRQLPGLGLRGRVGARGASPGRVLLARDGGVAGQLVLDARAGTTGGGQGGHQRPAQVLVDAEALDLPGAVEQPGHVVERPVAVGGRGVRAHEGQLLVAAGLGGQRQLAQPALPALEERGAPLGCGVRRRRGGGRARDPADAPGVGLAADVGEHELDVVGGGHLGVAGHVPCRTPDQGPGQRVVESRQAADRGGQRALVEPDLGVGQVGVVEQQQVGLGLAGELGDVGELALDVGLDVAGAHQAALDLVVEADADAVPAQLGPVGVRALAHREAGVAALGVEVELGAEGVDPRRLQPLLGPARQLAARGLLQGGEQVGELGVAVGEVLEVLLQAAEEVVEPDPGHELLEHRGALGVGDHVEVDLDGLEVVVVGRDRVRAGQLVGAVAGLLARVGEAGPGVGELGGLDLGVVAGPLGERLVEPQVVPPLHGDQVAEPHVRHLVQDHRAAELVERARLARARQVLVAQRHGAGVLHRAHVVLRHVELVVLAEGVGEVEGVLEEGEALLGDRQDVLEVALEVLHQRLAAVVAQRDGAVLALVDVLDLVVLTGDERGDVGRHRLGRLELPHGAAVAETLRLGGGGVGDDLPVLGRGDPEGEDRLEVGLLEGGVDPPGVGDLELRVEVDAVVGRVDEAVQALAGVGVGAVGTHDQLVVGGQVVEGDAAVGVRRGGVEAVPVEGDLVHGRVDEVGEARRPRLAAREGDRGRGGEGLLARREVQVDGVRRDVQEGGAGGGLVPGEVGSRHGAIIAPPRRAATTRYLEGSAA